MKGDDVCVNRVKEIKCAGDMAEMKMEFCAAVGSYLRSLEQGLNALERLEYALEQTIERSLISREAVLEPLVRLLPEMKKQIAGAREAILVSRT